jgi:hypothetical protein
MIHARFCVDPPDQPRKGLKGLGKLTEEKRKKARLPTKRSARDSWTNRRGRMETRVKTAKMTAVSTSQPKPNDQLEGTVPIAQSSIAPVNEWFT